MPLDRRGQRRFKLGTVINAQVIGQNGNPVGSTISGFLQDISIGGARFTAQNLKKDLGKKLLAERTTLTFPFEKDPPISVSGQIVGADFDDSSSSYTIRLQFPNQYIKENLNKLIDICKRLEKPDESKAIQQKLEQETHANAVVNFSSLGSLMDELSRVRKKLAEEYPSILDDEGIDTPTISNGSIKESNKAISKESSIITEAPPPPASPNQTPAINTPDPIPTIGVPEPTTAKKVYDSIEPEKPLEISIDEVPELTIETEENKPIEVEAAEVSLEIEPPPELLEITPEPINSPKEESVKLEVEPDIQLPKESVPVSEPQKVSEKKAKAKAPKKPIEKISKSKKDEVVESIIEIEVPVVEKSKETPVKRGEKKSENKSKPLATPSKASEKPKTKKLPKKPENKEQPKVPTEPIEKVAESKIVDIKEPTIEFEFPPEEETKETPVKPIEKKSEPKSEPVSSPSEPISEPKDKKPAEAGPKNTEPDESKPPVPSDKIIALIEEVKKDPKNVGLVQSLVDHYIEEGLYEDAIKSLKAVIKINPREAEIYLLLGDTHFKAELFQESLKPLGMALRLNPKLAKAHYIYSMANELVGKEEVGQKHYRIATMLDPNIESKV
jgi:hypothetical protein